MYRIRQFVEPAEQIEIIPLGDAHFGSPNCNFKSLVNLIEYIKNTPNCYVIGMGDYWDCFDEQTEILSNSGWKNFRNLTPQDKLLTFNQNENCLEYQNINSIIIKQYNGDMFNFRGRNLDLMVTPNHRILYKYYDSKKLHWSSFLVKSAQYFNINKTHKAVWKIPTSAPDLISDEYLIENDLIKLCGWLITEGWIEKRGNSVRFSVGQSEKVNKRKVVEIEGILRNLNIVFSRYTNRSGVVTWGISSQYKKLVDIFGNNDVHYIPRILLNMNKNQLLTLFNTLIAGDGSIKANGVKTFATVHKILKDNFEELCIKLGLNFSVRKVETKNKPIFIFYITNGVKGQNSVGVKDLIKEKYTGIIWCVNVDNSFVVVRRNDKVCITGNCIIPKDPRFDASQEFNLIDDAYGKIKDLFLKVKERFLCLLIGNHEYSLVQDGYGNLVKRLASELHAPYAGFSCFLKLETQKSKKIIFYCHHGWFSGRQRGSKINNLENLMRDYEADVYLAGHSHDLFATRRVKISWNGDKKVIFANTGSFLETATWGTTGYGERAGYPPQKLGVCKIKWYPEKNDLHISE